MAMQLRLDAPAIRALIADDEDFALVGKNDWRA